MATWKSRRPRSSTYTSANSERNSPTPAAAWTTSKPFGDEATPCENQLSAPSRVDGAAAPTREMRVAELRLCSITRLVRGSAGYTFAGDRGRDAVRPNNERASQAVAHDDVWCSVRPIYEHASQPVGHNEVWCSVRPDDKSASHAVSNFLSRCGQCRKHKQPSHNECKMAVAHG